ncbi:MAG: Bax inhibitor-1/YccA family protein [Actinomycetes bacterium]|nr:Bax inhibitor-1/YccA family protein [Actinomycetes bacterium]MDX5380373.1 Bax inhibitor-1/YccA family protein [Actinomycetes bacterium]MDX5399164.1 Bax inhibitor-1/YccA family protein [Actinomycetes bacterium]MDX5450106.1 Bax inhibitor-1/YccA family protein [Actinomycetes bacterium]
MSNPALNKAFGSKMTPAGYPEYPGYTPRGGAGTAQAPRQQAQYQAPQYGQQYGQTQYPNPADLEQAYNMPPAGPAQTGRLTLDDVIVKTAFTLGLVVLTGAGAWALTIANPGLGMGLAILGAIAGFVLGLVNAFRKEPSPALILAYAGFQGLFLGGISAWFEAMYPGIVIQAVLATVVTFGVTLGLYTTRIVRVSSRMIKFVMIAMVSYLAFSLVNLVLMLTGVTDGMFGLRSTEVMGIPLGLLVGAFAVLLATFSLLIDFHVIEQGVKAGVPARYAWSGAFGLTVTLIWLYIEFLRIIAIFRGE